MKYKLKELSFNDLNFTTTHTINSGKIYNLNEPIEFQTPKVKIIDMDDNYLTLKILATEASRIFFIKIHEFEQQLKKKFSNQQITSIFDGDTFKVKIKNKNFKVYFNCNLFNLYHLKPGMDIICLVSISKIWMNIYNVISYNLKVDEILIRS